MSFLERYLGRRPRPDAPQPAPEGRVHHAGQGIAYRVVVASDSRRRRAAIRVRPGGAVEVHLPRVHGHVDVPELVARHAGWILRKQAELGNLPAAPEGTACASGEMHWFLGERHCLQVVRDPRRHVGLDAGSGRLQVLMPVPTPARVRQALEAWETAQARRVFSQLVAEKVGVLPWLSAMPPLKLRRMRARWGSCSARGGILLNTHLVKAPVELIDYVVMHELCHLVEHNHSPRYYALLSRHVPDWKEKRRRLNRLGAQILPI